MYSLVSISSLPARPIRKISFKNKLNVSVKWQQKNFPTVFQHYKYIKFSLKKRMLPSHEHSKCRRYVSYWRLLCGELCGFHYEHISSQCRNNSPIVGSSNLSQNNLIEFGERNPFVENQPDLHFITIRRPPSSVVSILIRGLKLPAE